MPVLRAERTTGYLTVEATLPAVDRRITAARSAVDRSALSSERDRDLPSEEAEMSATSDTNSSRPRVVCELDGSVRAEGLLDDALALCEEHGAEIVIVWVLEPRLFASPYPGNAGAVGTFGLPHVLHAAVERARAGGIPATSAVRIGEREVVLRREVRVADAAALFRLAGDRVTTSRGANAAVVRCPKCGSRQDGRAVHYCPRLYVEPATARVQAPVRHGSAATLNS
jgi:hypothetical protein